MSIDLGVHINNFHFETYVNINGRRCKVLTENKYLDNRSNGITKRKKGEKKKTLNFLVYYFVVFLHKLTSNSLAFIRVLKRKDTERTDIYGS